MFLIDIFIHKFKNAILLKNKDSKNYIFNFIFVIKYSLSYKHISRGHISY